MLKKYIVAVSGGVDSAVLLHKLVSVKPDTITYIVAHFDHGVRDESAGDAAFVEDLARQYECAFVTERAELGEGVSEEAARDARYDFLFRMKERFGAEAVVVAHHQDDVLETMILNISRGTSPRGLIGFTRPGIVRPFMYKTKNDLLQYAKEQGLQWREDSTNNDETYARNYIRHKVLPRLDGGTRKTLLETRDDTIKTYAELDDLTGKLLVALTEKEGVSRTKFVTLPYPIQKEIWARLLRLEGVEINRNMVERAVLATKTLHLGKRVELHKDTWLISGQKHIHLRLGVEK